jgi:hypothetical protein
MPWVSAADHGMATGTADAGHMREDLEVFDFQLGAEDVEWIEGLARP